MTNDAVLKQLGYSVTDSAMEQLDKVIENTDGYEYVKKHLITMHDQLQSKLSCVALSSSHDYFKIKNLATGDEMVDEVTEMIIHWSEKYKIAIEKVDGKETYYVLGHK